MENQKYSDNLRTYNEASIVAKFERPFQSPLVSETKLAPMTDSDKSNNGFIGTVLIGQTIPKKQSNFYQNRYLEMGFTEKQDAILALEKIADDSSNLSLRKYYFDPSQNRFFIQVAIRQENLTEKQLNGELGRNMRAIEEALLTFDPIEDEQPILDTPAK